MKKNIATNIIQKRKPWIIIACLFTLSACGDEVPNEFALLKYKPIVIPDNTNLPKPSSDGVSLANLSTENGVLKDLNIPSSKTNVSASTEVLKSLKIKPVDYDVNAAINDMPDSYIIVDAKKEITRLKDNKENNRSITYGRTPTYNKGADETGLDKLLK